MQQSRAPERFDQNPAWIRTKPNEPSPNLPRRKMRTVVYRRTYLPTQETPWKHCLDLYIYIHIRNLYMPGIYLPRTNSIRGLGALSNLRVYRVLIDLHRVTAFLISIKMILTTKSYIRSGRYHPYRTKKSIYVWHHSENSHLSSFPRMTTKRGRGGGGKGGEATMLEMQKTEHKKSST